MKMVYLLDADIGIEVKGLPLTKGGWDINKQLKKYTDALNEVWLCVANNRSSGIAKYNVDRIICVDEFPTCVSYIRDKIDNY